MKLIIAIVQDEDSSRLIGQLMNDGFGVTKLATTGGFLRAGNTTLLVGVEDDRFQEAMDLIEKVARAASRSHPRPRPWWGCRVPTPLIPSKWWWAARPSSCSPWISL